MTSAEHSKGESNANGPFDSVVERDQAALVSSALTTAGLSFSSGFPRIAGEPNIIWTIDFEGGFSVSLWMDNAFLRSEMTIGRIAGADLPSSESALPLISEVVLLDAMRLNWNTPQARVAIDHSGLVVVVADMELRLLGPESVSKLLIHGLTLGGRVRDLVAQSSSEPPS